MSKEEFEELCKMTLTQSGHTVLEKESIVRYE